MKHASQSERNGDVALVATAVALAACVLVSSPEMERLSRAVSDGFMRMGNSTPIVKNSTPTVKWALWAGPPRGPFEKVHPAAF